ncbi:peptidoglycan DD-metalloendopeptidase family protein [Dongia sedimenti]|uniref:Peptidoglycan DD-metalloendopeptidase family protein n=1 Tax=Dongia sedimenti TaxID=3064282 RepID=A0ABU0YJ26_9PROT|nr:peptidoglycan DD-metalloendopeptidase family protein [Rhodospirillaceae bacterium R-7]
MDSRPIILAALCLALAACNASGRPKNAPKVAEPVAAARPSVDPASFGKTVGNDYVVAPGDTLAVVAERTNTPIRSLIDMNGLQPPYGLAPGMRLALKQRSQYVVQREDTLEDLATRYGVSQSDLVAVNNLTPPFTLKPGQTLNIPSQSESSNLPALSAAAVPPPTPAGAVSAAPLPPPGGTVTAPKAVAPTMTATNGSGVSAAPLPSPTVIAPSATLPKPAAPVVTTPAAPKPAAPSAAAAQALPTTPTAPVTSAPPKTQTAATTAKAKTPEEVEAETQAAMEAVEAAKESGPAAGTGKGPFVWPVQGKVIGAFGSSTEGLKNDGINIAAPSGAPVVAAADGTVAYAGNELRGFGNMILIRHDGGYVTAYAHNASLLVKKGDKVKRGQTIARVGQTGAVFGPQLHFEIRKGTQPVDPMSFLGG